MSCCKDAWVVVWLRCWTVVPLRSPIQRKSLGRASPWAAVFVTRLFFALKVETAAFLESVFGSSWLPAAVNLHSPFLVCLASELTRTSVGRAYPGQSDFTSDNVMLVAVLPCLPPSSFCLSGWRPVGQMGIINWKAAFLGFFGLVTGFGFFVCLVYLVLSLRSFVSFLFARNASNFK